MQQIGVVPRVDHIRETPYSVTQGPFVDAGQPLTIPHLSNLLKNWE